MLFTVPLLDLVLLTSGTGAGGPSTPVITVATPLRAVVSLFPVTSAPINATGGGGIPTLLARIGSDHILRVQTIRNDVTLATVVPTKIKYTIADASSVLVTSEVTSPTNTDDWQIALTRTLFTPSRGALTLTLTLVAPSDSTETQLQFLLALGVRQ